MSHVKRTAPLSIFIFLSFITVLAQQHTAVHSDSVTWVNVTPANGGFTVLMPAKPFESVEPVASRPGVMNHTLWLETKLASYVVSYVEFPEDVTDPVLIKEILDRGREGGIRSSEAELKSETEIKLKGYFGREWSLKLPEGVLATARAYWVKRRLYQTLFLTSPKASDTPEAVKLRQEAATKFLDSFTLVDSVSISRGRTSEY
jgi:hypothetical protein